MFQLAQIRINSEITIQSQVIDYIVRYGENLLEPRKFNLINTTFNIIQMVVDEAVEVNAEDYQKFLVSWMQAATMFGIAWGIGGILNEESRKKFDQFHKKVSNSRIQSVAQNL